MSFIRPQQDLNSSKLGEEFYQAEVIDNLDLNMLGRVKIRVQELHGTNQDIPDENLPWAMQFRPSFLGGDTDLSTFSVPKIGSKVIVTHVRGDIYQPAYMFELNHSGNKIEKISEDYPNSYGFVDSDSNFWHVNLVQDKLDILFNGTQCMQITVDNIKTVDNDETVTIGNDRTISVINDETRTIGNNFEESTTNTHTQNAATFNINTTGDTNVTAAGNVKVEGAQITLNGSGGGVINEESIDPFTGLPHVDGSSTVKNTK